jgi:hypothetical protein
LSFVASVPLPALAADATRNDADAGFLRVTRDERGSPRTLDTAVVSYTNGREGDERVTVDLVAAIHVGDRAYYETLNRKFESYDAVLYELVAPEGATPDDRPAEGDPHPIAVMQDGLKSLLDLEHQLAVVDYRKPNFVHADMSPEDFEKAMKDRGESFVTMFLRLAFEGMRKPPQAGAGEADDLKLILALLSPNRPMALKRVMAGQIAQFGDIASALDGPGGSAIVSDRNRKALEVLRAALDDGKRRVCIFYGAAHMPDFEKRLLADFGLQRADREWIVAWDMKPNPQSNEFLERLRKNREAREKARRNP